MVKSISPIALESGGFLHEIELQAPLLIPVQLTFVYFDAGSDEQMTFTSRETFFGSTIIRYIADEDNVPFDRFRMSVALVYKRDLQQDLVGPFSVRSIEYGECLCSVVK